MACTIIEYLREERSSFDEAPLCDADSLIFSTIAYLKLDKGILGRAGKYERVPFSAALCSVSRADLLGTTWLSRIDGPEFLKALISSPRFMKLEVGYCVNEVSDDIEKQFAALTFFLPGDGAYVAFDGTDNSLTGWKENFNITFMEQVPSQVCAREYIEEVASMVSGRLYLGGHSKGGNLAEYAALTCNAYTYAQIARVFNHDGPGFVKTPSRRYHSKQYEVILRKVVPEGSVIGMVLEERTNYQIVPSSGMLFAQHASTHWAIEDGKFVCAETLSPEAIVIADAFKNWTANYGPEERGMLIDTAFAILKSTNAETLTQLKKGGVQSVRSIVESTAHLPSEMRSKLFGMLMNLASLLSAERSNSSRGAIQPS